jgi:hypothetical protein
MEIAGNLMASAKKLGETTTFPATDLPPLWDYLGPSQSPISITAKDYPVEGNPINLLVVEKNINQKRVVSSQGTIFVYARTLCVLTKQCFVLTLC